MANNSLNIQLPYGYSIVMPEWWKWPSALSRFAPTWLIHHLRKRPNGSPLVSREYHSFLIKHFTSPKCSSIGFKSGEYGESKRSSTPAAEQSSLSFQSLWKLALSITRTDLGCGNVPQWRSSCLIKSSNMTWSVEPRKTRDSSIPSWA